MFREVLGYPQLGSAADSGPRSREEFYASEKKAFHGRLTTGTNCNLIAINDQLPYVEPDIILIAIMKVKQ